MAYETLTFSKADAKLLLKQSKLSPTEYSYIKTMPGHQMFVWNAEEQLYVKKHMEI